MQSLMISCLASLISVFFIQFTLFVLALFLPTSSFFTLLPLTALLIVILVGLGRCCKRLVGVKACAPAFVFLSILFLWVVYISVIRRVTSYLMDIVFNIEIVMLIVGLYRIMLSDPGFVRCDSSYHEMPVRSPLNEDEAHIEELEPSTHPTQQESHAEEGLIVRRGRYCKYCDAYVNGFDHHCPAFGNCIGEKNHFFFVLLLIGFVISEASYVACASQFAARFQTIDEVKRVTSASRSLAISTMLFSLFQVLWQVVFIMWHVYCACFNIKTDEWINWKTYPEFQVQIISDAGLPQTDLQFKNPYDKGILRNLKEFLTAKG
ncbi:probable palmitoyltransferase ZDHHC12 isoform X1 [Olea europaea subsp. europaea]|uniref:S-acyltransferase n=1 Tax=Olea europaea subsp. europaea TaxID=158383 RepID=A0A8S0S9A8_OLEEU|nr:probable palmitoyltransferase ZDHHC12 isoform X1 [Olea europaea subsp. europaea]